MSRPAPFSAASGVSRVADQSVLKTALRICGNAALRKAAVELIITIMRFFFFPQHRAALLPGRVPVSPVDHPLDRYIPFEPRWVNVYLDFVPFWIRMTGFLLETYGRGSTAFVLDFLVTMKKLYRFAAEVYLKNFSTTKRPRYYGNLRFLIIHITDPHLCCIPSLHVMIVLRTFTKFREILKIMGEGEEKKMEKQIEELKRGALNIAEAVLYVKQHSLNCISAAMYAMIRFDPSLFNESEAEEFASQLFTAPDSPPESSLVRNYIIARFRSFCAAGVNSKWDAPLIAFLQNPTMEI